MSTVRRPRVQRETEHQEREQHTEVNTLFGAENQPLLATNTGVRLACTMAAMLSPFAVFLCWVEKESQVIRRFAVQSVALSGVHLCGALLLGVISLVVGRVPYFGFLMTLLGWMIYVAVAVVVLAARIKLMERAWYGRKFELPLLERLIRRYY